MRNSVLATCHAIVISVFSLIHSWITVSKRTTEVGVFIEGYLPCLVE